MLTIVDFGTANGADTAVDVLVIPGDWNMVTLDAPQPRLSNGDAQVTTMTELQLVGMAYLPSVPGGSAGLI
ncbi:MAG TPA: hypothetical protein VIT92_00495 [Burkholderiaceae bacterium]